MAHTHDSPGQIYDKSYPVVYNIYIQSIPVPQASRLEKMKKRVHIAWFLR